MIYRSYRYGVRFTVEAKSPTEARERLTRLKRDYQHARNVKAQRRAPWLTSDLLNAGRSLDELHSNEL
jgi:hypothetical protein